jgi:hypothetical protein
VPGGGRVWGAPAPRLRLVSPGGLWSDGRPTEASRTAASGACPIQAGLVSYAPHPVAANRARSCQPRLRKASSGYAENLPGRGSAYFAYGSAPGRQSVTIDFDGRHYDVPVSRQGVWAFIKARTDPCHTGFPYPVG